MSRDWAATHRTGSGARHQREKKNTVALRKTPVGVRRTYNGPEHVDREHCHNGLDLHAIESQVAPTRARPPNSSAHTTAHQKGAANSVSMGIGTRETRAPNNSWIIIVH